MHPGRAALALGVAALCVYLWAPARPTAPPLDTREAADVAPPAPIEIAAVVQVEAPGPEPAPEPEPEPEAKPEPTAAPPPPRPAPAPAPPTEPAVAEASPAAAVPAPPTAVPAPDPARGRRWLERGSFPRLRATYARVGFPAYRDAVLSLGGGLVLLDGRARRALARIDPVTLAPSDAPLPANLSRWPRDVTRHVPEALAAGRERFGARATRVVLLPPAAIDAALLAAIDAELRRLGRDAASLRSVELAYELRGGALGCQLLGLRFADGTRPASRLHVDLSQAVRS